MSDTLRAAAEAAKGRCHRCAILRQEHRPGMGHRIEDRMGADPTTVLALIAERDALAARVERLTEALERIAGGTQERFADDIARAALAQPTEGTPPAYVHRELDVDEPSLEAVLLTAMARTPLPEGTPPVCAGCGHGPGEHEDDSTVDGTAWCLGTMEDCPCTGWQEPPR